MENTERYFDIPITIITRDILNFQELLALITV